MTFIKEDLAYNLNKFGYSIRFYNDKFVIMNSSSSSFLMASISVLGGIVLLIIAGAEPQVLVLSLLLIIYPIATFRKNSHRKLTFGKGILSIDSSKFLIPTHIEIRLEDYSLELSEYDRSSYTSPFEEGSKEYFIELFLLFRDKKVELFHFMARDKSQLIFAVDLYEQIKEWITNLNHSKET